MKVLTIPKLELQASLLASRLFQQLKVELSCAIEAVYMWSDSKTVVQWLRSSDKKHPVFVANRLSEILEHTTVDQWHHVPGELNPADCATRGLPADELLSSAWLTGRRSFVTHRSGLHRFQRMNAWMKLMIRKLKCHGCQLTPRNQCSIDRTLGHLHMRDELWHT